jgi:hypothetical protein
VKGVIREKEEVEKVYKEAAKGGKQAALGQPSPKEATS